VNTTCAGRTARASNHGACGRDSGESTDEGGRVGQ